MKTRTYSMSTWAFSHEMKLILTNDIDHLRRPINSRVNETDVSSWTWSQKNLQFTSIISSHEHKTWMTIIGAIIKRISDWTPLHYNEAIIWPRRVARHTPWRVLTTSARMTVSYTHKSWQKTGSHRAQELNLILRVSAFSHDELRQSTAAIETRRAPPL